MQFLFITFLLALVLGFSFGSAMWLVLLALFHFYCFCYCCCKYFHFPSHDFAVRSIFECFASSLDPTDLFQLGFERAQQTDTENLANKPFLLRNVRNHNNRLHITLIRNQIACTSEGYTEKSWRFTFYFTLYPVQWVRNVEFFFVLPLHFQFRLNLSGLYSFYTLCAVYGSNPPPSPIRSILRLEIHISCASVWMFVFIFFSSFCIRSRTSNAHTNVVLMMI